MNETDRRYGGKSGTERVAERRDKLVSAGLDLLVDHGTRKVTVTGVCAAAGLSERYFYESFKQREDLLNAIFDRVAGYGVDAVIKSVAHASDPEARAFTVVEQLVEVMLDDDRLSRMARDHAAD